MTCDRLKEVHQHLLSNVLAQHQTLHHRMIIVEACTDASILYLLLKVLGTAESVNVGRVEECAADGKVHVRSSEIAFQDSRDRDRETSMS